MSYIITNEGNIKCIHPSVNKIWIYGACSATKESKCINCVAIELTNGERHDFDDNFKEDINIALNFCDQFLNNLEHAN